MTISLVLKPEFSVTFSRGLLRITGTVIGLLVATGLFHFLPPVIGVEVVLVGLFVFLVRWIGPANYGIFAINVSALVVLIVAFTGVAPQDVIFARGLMTTIGGMTALATYALWPTWEGTRTSEGLAKMLESYLRYFHAVGNRFLGANQTNTVELDGERQQARRARSALEASVDRLRLEPVANASDLRALSAMLASSHRFINATMALEGSHEKVASPHQALTQFMEDVEKTLGTLVFMLRGDLPSSRQFPDLREDHHAMLEALGRERYPLLADETDRITNSLNTLREQLQAWTGSKQPNQKAALEPQPA